MRIGTGIAAVGAALAAMLGAVVPAPPANAQTLRVVMHSDLKILDPIWTTAYIVRSHGYLVYDTLVSMDAELHPQPQMLEKWQVSDDKLTWTFTLRAGLEFHDGTPVGSEDCVASIRRWAAKDSMGQKLMSFVKELKALDGKAFQMTLKEPYGLVLESLGKPSSNVLFIMPKRLAETDPNTQISDATGSGPFIFKRDEWKPGEKVVYVKNPKYKPRDEPASGVAGGKVAKVDRVEWVWISDTQTQANALVAGEIDMIESPQHDLLPVLARDRNIELKIVNSLGNQYTFRFNTLHKPFDDARVRRALWYAFNQKDFLDGVIGDPKWYKPCKAMFVCGTPLDTTKGMEDKLESDFAKAKALLQEAGYDGTPIVLMHSTDLYVLNNLAPVAKSLMERAGFKVDMVSMDWQTLVSRRNRKDPPTAGGWHAFLTSWAAVDILNPVMAAYFNAGCEKASFGWPCDREIERLRDQFARESDPVRQKAIAEAVQLRVVEYPTHIHLGQWYNPIARRRNVEGNIVAPVTVFWNVSKK